MKRFLTAVMMLAILAMPVYAQSADSITIPFAVLISPEHSVPSGSDCTLLDSNYITSLEAIPTPYGEVHGDNEFHGRMVNAEQSPIPGQDGCLFEYSIELQQADKYAIQLRAYGNHVDDFRIDLGSFQHNDLATMDGPVIYLIDQEALEVRVAAPLNMDMDNPSTPESSPDYQATITAQEAEIESLKATIEALETPEP